MTDKPYPSRVADQFQVRFPDGMRDRIAAAAKANGRSMNSEIVARLEASISTPAVSADGWEEVRSLTRRKDQLQARLIGLQGVALQINEEQRSARVGGLTPDDMAEIEDRARENRLEIYDVNVEMKRVLDQLDDAYSKVEGQPTSGYVKMTRAEG